MTKYIVPSQKWLEKLVETDEAALPVLSAGNHNAISAADLVPIDQLEKNRKLGRGIPMENQTKERRAIRS